MIISDRDLTQLAVMLTKTLNSVEMNDARKKKNHIDKTLKLLDKLETRYSKQSIFQDARDALNVVDKDIIRIYVFTRDLISGVRSHIHGSNKSGLSYGF